MEAGETYKQLADVKYSLEDNVKQNFIEPLQHIQTKDLKEVNVRRAPTLQQCYVHMYYSHLAQVVNVLVNVYVHVHCTCSSETT